MVGARYEVRACRSTRRLELLPCGGKEAERAFTVSRRERNGVVVPLLEFRSPDVTSHHVTDPSQVPKPMKTSNRVVIEVDPVQKQKIYAELKARGLTMREWFLQQVSQELSIPQPTKPSSQSSND